MSSMIQACTKVNPADFTVNRSQENSQTQTNNPLNQIEEVISITSNSSISDSNSSKALNPTQKFTTNVESPDVGIQALDSTIMISQNSDIEIDEKDSPDPTKPRSSSNIPNMGVQPRSKNIIKPSVALARKSGIQLKNGHFVAEVSYDQIKSKRIKSRTSSNAKTL